MSRTISVPEELYDRAAVIAARDHVSVEDFVSGVLENWLANRAYIEEREKLFNREAFEQALDRIPDTEPGEGDRV